MKQNDWIVANMNNPDFTSSDFKNIGGLSLENTQLLPFSDYLTKEKITTNPMFFDDSGKFSENIFKEFYNEKAYQFQNFAQDSALDNYEYGFWDIRQTSESRVQNPNFNISMVANPTHQSTGVVGINIQGEREKSDFELAEKQKIYDWKTGKFRDETPEDSALFSNPVKFVENLFSDPLVLAEYEEDEIDPITGEQHYKGEKKLNEDGEYYFETLGGRSVVGKKVLSLGDILTKEDSWINKYDFFDSDDIQKSTGGVIMKNLVSIAPMAFLGPSGTMWYSGFFVAREIAKSLPMLSNIVTMFSDSEDPKLLNTISGFGEKFTGGTSDYAKNTTFSFENLGNLISDVALQWGQQKFIANSISKVKGSTNAILEAAEGKAALEYEKRASEIWNRAYTGEKIAAKEYTMSSGLDDIKDAVSSGRWKASSIGAAAMEKYMPEARKAFDKRAQFGQDLSLVYMAIISNYDVYNDALEHGTSEVEAAAIALGSTFGMFAVDKYAHLGEVFFDETPEKLALKNLRQGIVDEASELSKKIGSNLAKEAPNKKGLLSLMKKSADKASNFIKNYKSDLKNHSLGFFGKAFGEGLEEMSEEAVTDVMKSLYQLADVFGWTSQKDIGAWDNMRERYLMSLLGGAVGGGIFYGVDAIKNPKNTVDQNTQKELLYLVSQGKTNEILKNLDDLKSKGKLASKDLSIDTVEDDSGNKIFISANEDHESQNDYVYRIMKNSILQMESILNEHSLKLTDDQLFEKMVLSNHRYMTLKDKLFDKSYITQYYDDFQQLSSDIYNIEKDIQELKDSNSDDTKRQENSDYDQKLKNLEDKRKELLKRKESFLKGEYNLDYVDKMLFYIHPEVNSYFYSSMFEQWVQNKYNKDVSELSEGELDKYSNEWEKLKKTKGKQLLDEAFTIYKNTRSDIEAGLNEVANDNVLSWGELLNHLNETSPDNENNQILQWNDKIPSRYADADTILDKMGVIKTAQYDKPWRNDPTKKNKAFQLQLSEDSSAAFEIVKDHEDGYWSIHFKTPRTLTSAQKQRLFISAAAVIPEGDKLSTWGELTKGGISGINRFGQLEFLNGIEFQQVGTRQVKTKPLNPDDTVYTEGTYQERYNKLVEDGIIDKYWTKINGREVIIANINGKKVPFYKSSSGTDGKTKGKWYPFFGLGAGSSMPGDTTSWLIKGSSIEEMDNGYNIPSIQRVQNILNNSLDWNAGEEFVGKSHAVFGDSNGDNGLALNSIILGKEESEVQNGVNAEQFIKDFLSEIDPSIPQEQKDIEIPIWEKVNTKETDEDYNDRDKKREGESEEQFKQRVKLRKNRIKQYNNDHIIDIIKKFLSVNDIIDTSTYRRLTAALGTRRSDILKHLIKNSKSLKELKASGLVTASSISRFNSLLQEGLEKLHPDLSNRNEVVQDVLSKTSILRTKQFDEKNEHRKVNFDSQRLQELLDPDFTYDEDILDKMTEMLDDNNITIQRLVDDIDTIYSGKKISISENVNRDEFPLTFSELKDSFYMVNNDSEGSVLFNEALQTAIEIHNLKIDDSINGTDSSDKINQLEESINKQTFKKDSTGEDTGKLLLTENDYDFESNEEVSFLSSLQESQINDIIDEIEQDDNLSTLNELRRKTTIDLNPVVKIMRAVLPKLGEDFGDIDQTLDAIYNQFESLEIPTSFTLSQQQTNALQKFYKYFNFVRAVVRSAKTKSTYANYLPYNNSLNAFIDDNKDVIKNVQKLLELDDDLANVIEQSFELFGREIERWVKLSERGSINKREMFSKFDQNFNKARLEFFNQIKDQCKIGEKDLFRGFETIDIDKPDAIVEIEKLVYNNFKKQGWNESDLIKIIQKQVKADKVIKQDSGLNKSLDSEFVFTDYDKFILMTSLVAADPIDFYEYYKDYVASSKGKDGQKIAPLTFQEYNIKLGYIQRNSMDFINKVFKGFLSTNNIEMSTLKNALIISGIAGVGKTDVVIRGLQYSDSVWVSGPSDTQIDGLKKIIPHATTYGHAELFNAILGTQYSEILQEVQQATAKKLQDKNAQYDGKYIKVEKQYPILKLDKINFVTKDAPKQLVIDEITLFSNTEIQLLSEWASKTGTHLIFAGDTHQNGDKSVGFNIDPDFTFAFRTPEMKISLRDSNIWKYKNQQAIVDQIDEMNRFWNAERSKKYLKNFNFHYYLDNDKFTGEIVVDKLNDNITKNLKGTIAFIGNTSSENYQKLKGTGKDIEVFESVDKIQGKEFDYLISDIDLNFNPIEGYSDQYNLLTYLNNLYTIITRSKHGSILIDNGLTNVIKGSVQEQYSNNNVGITPEITEQYVNEKINFLNSLNLSREIPLEEKEEPLTQETIIDGEQFEEENKETEENQEEEPETEDDSYLDIEAEQETITPVYGNLNLSGLIMDQNSKKLHKSGNRDLGIFLEDGQEIDIKDRPLEVLYELKSLIHFDRLSDSFWYDQSKVRNFFTLEELQNIKYYVSAEDYNPQTHRLLTKEAGYEEGEQIFSVKGGPKKLFTLIGVIEKDGKQYEITLGGLSNPITLRKNADDIFDKKTGKIINKGTITRIRERAAATNDDRLKQKLLDYANSYKDKVDYYENQLVNLTQRGRWQIRKPSFDRCTRVSRMKNKDGSRQYHPLNEYFDLNTSQYVVSPIYTQVNRNDGEDTVLPGLDDKFKGKPVIFVSAFKLYNPTELADIYARQKQDPENNYPEVRKIILDPRGIMFGDLVNEKILELKNSDKLVFPFSATATSFRMYMSLWNFRAKITKFNEEVDNYLRNNNLDVSTIESLAREESENYLNGNTAKNDKFKALYDLNDYLESKGVQQFRLGYSSKNGFYSRKINDTTKGTFINYQMAQDYQKVIDLLFKNVIDKIITPPSVNTVKSIMGKTSDFDKHLAAETWVKKLSGQQEIKLSFKTDNNDEVVNFSVEKLDLFKSLPLTLVHICRNLKFAQQFNGGGVKGFRQMLADDPTLFSWWYIRLKDERTNENEDLDYLSITDGLTGGLKDVDPLNTVESPGIRTYKDEQGIYDRRILNLFELAFHGRIGHDTENVTNNSENSDPEVKRTFIPDGILLKYGMFADTFTVEAYNANKAFKTSSAIRALYRTNAMPSSPVLKIDITEWDGRQEQTEEQIEKARENTELSRVNSLLGTSFTSLSDISIYIANNLNGLFENPVGSRTFMKTIIESEKDDSGTYSFKTVKDVIKDTTGLDINNVESVQDNSQIYYKFGTGDGDYIITIQDGKLHIEPPIKNIKQSQDPVVQSPSDKFVEEINKLNNYFDVIRSEIEEESGNTDIFDNYIKTLTNPGLKLEDLKTNLSDFIGFLKSEDNNSSLSNLSTIQNEFNKIICNL